MEHNQHAGAEHAAHPVEKKGNIMAVFSYLGILIIIPMLTEAKNDPFVKYHIRQGLTLLVLEVVSWAIGVIPILGWMIGWILWLVSIVLAIIGILHVMNGEEKELPLIGNYAKNFNF